MATNQERKLINIPQTAEEKARFTESIVGQDEAVAAFATLLVRIRSGIRPSASGPIDVKFLAGPSGVGKTETVYRLAEILAETDPTADNSNPRSKVIRIDASAYQSKSELARLLGSPPGYIGSKDPRFPGGTEPIFSQANLDRNRIVYIDKRGQQKNVIIILVDEAEKAHRSVDEAFLSVLDKGEMQLGNNTTTDFKDAVVFFTSNAGNVQVERLREEISNSGRGVPENFREAIGEALIKDSSRDVIARAFREAFAPEFRGRIRDLIIFQPLGKDALEQIVAMKIRTLEHDLRANDVDVNLKVLPKVVEWLVAQGYNPSEGARALGKVIDEFIGNPLIMANSCASLHQQKVVIDMEEYGWRPNFYSVSSTIQASTVAIPAPEPIRNDATQPHTSSESGKLDVPKIPDALKKTLLNRLTHHGIGAYMEYRDGLVKRGLLATEVANLQPEIILVAKNQLIDRMRHHGLRAYIRLRDRIARAGILPIATANELPEISGVAGRELIKRWETKVSQDAFIAYRNRLVRAGIGTVEEWNALIHES